VITVVRRIANVPAAISACLLLLLAMASLSVGSEDWRDNAGQAVAQLPSPAVLAALALALVVVAHYVLAAVALRAVGDRKLSLRTTTTAQLAAAAANRITPGSLGGAGVNARFLMRSGMPAGAAVSSVAALTMLTSLTTAALVMLATTVGPLVGLSGAASVFGALTSHTASGGHKKLGLFVILAVALVAVVIKRGARRTMRGLVSGLRQALAHLRDLAMHPQRLATASLAAAATTCVMCAGFAVTVSMWGQAAHPLPVGGLAAVYLVGVAAGAATPLPPIACVTEMSLIGSLALTGYTRPSALLAVVIFRAVTYWLPLPAGVWAARRLRATHNL
jgi:uncharacterized membrane protein YbhN (UPF0104 family)